MRRNRLIGVSMVVAICSLAASLVFAAAQAQIGKPAPDFTLKDQAGKEVKLSDLRGKIVVLEWFNAGCPVTQRHHSAKSPTMKTTAEKYSDKGVVWLAVHSNSDGSVERNADAARELGVAYPILDDSTGKVGRAYGATATPHMFIIDKNGVLAYAGAIDDDPQGGKAHATNYIVKALDELLAGTTVTTPRTRAYGCGIKYAQ